MGPVSPREILDVLDDVIIQYDPEGIVAWASSSLRTVLGYDPAVVVGTHFRLPATASGGAPPLDPVELPDRWRGLLQLPRADGSLAWMDVSTRQVRDGRTLAATLVLVRDAAADAGADWLPSHQHADIVQRLDPQNRTVWISPSVRWLTGWAPEEMLGDTRLSRIHPADAATAAEQLIAVHSGQPEVTVEVRLRHRSGTYLWWQVTARRVESDGAPSDVLLLYRNIDAEVRQRHEASRQARLFRSTLDAALDPMVLVRPVWDARGQVVDLSVVAVNHQVVRVVSRPEPELEGQPLGELLPPETVAALTRTAGQVMDDGQAVSLSAVAVGQAFGNYAHLRMWCADDLLGVTWDCLATLTGSHEHDVVSFTTSPQGRLEAVGDCVKALLGIAAGDLVGARLEDLVHPDDLAALEAAGRGVAGGHPSRIDVRLRTGARGWRAVHQQSRPVFDDAGTLAAVAGTWQAAEESDAEPGPWWRPVLDTSLDPMVVLEGLRDEGGCIVDFTFSDANRAAWEYLRESREALLASTVGGQLAPEQRRRLLPLLVDLAESGEPLITDDLAIEHKGLPAARRLDVRGVKVGDQLLVNWRDITDRMTAEARLAQSERRYRLLAENASEVVIQTGSDRLIEWVSPSVRQVLGYRPEDLVGRRVSDLLERHEMQRLRQEMAANVAQHRPGGERRMRFTTADGSSRWMSALGHALIDEQGQVAGGVDALRDIHEEVLAQEALAASQARLAMLLDAMAEGVVVRDASGVITQCNPAAQAILGLPEGEIVGRSGPLAEWRGIHEDGSEFPVDELPEVVALRTGRSVRGVVLGVRLPDDEVSWLLIDAEVLRERGTHEVTGVVSTFVDITERIRAAQQMQQAEARFRLLAENASDFVLMAGQDGELVWASPSVEQILGWKPEELLNTTAQFLLHPDDHDLIPQWRKAAAEGLTTTHRVRVRHADGTYRWFIRSAHPVSDDPEAPRGLVAGYRDIQAEVEAEELLAASERRYRLLAETMTDLVEEYDASWYLVWASPSAMTLLGFSPEELIGSFAPNLIHPDDDTTDDRDSVDAGLGQRISEYRRRVRRLRADGSYVWVDSALSFRYDEQGEHVATYITSRDVDAEVRAQQELARSEQRFSRMFTEHDAIMLLVDPASGAIVDANRAASRYYGYSREQLASMNITDISATAMEPVMDPGTDASTFPHRLADGTVRTVEIHSSTIDDRDRTLLFSIVRDITEDLEAREQLAASEQRYRLLAENATDFVVYAGVDGVVKWISPSAERLLGWRPSDVIGRSVEDFVHPGDLPSLAAQRSDASAGRMVMRRFRIRTADGAWHWFMASSKPVHDEAGVLTGRVTGFQDVQAETRAREELRHAHERLELVLDSSRLGFWDWDMRTDQIVLNDRWAHIVGYDLDELSPATVGTWSALVHPDDRPRSEQAIAAHGDGDVDYYDVDVRMRHKDGQWVWVRDRGRIVERDDDGKPLRMTGTLEDVTALKAAIEALEASEQRFRVAMASAPVGMAVLALDRTITQVNPALCALLGYNEQWLVGRNISEIVDESDDVIDRSARTRLRRTPEQAVTVEHRLVRSDHARVWVQQSLNLVYGPGGRATGYVSQFADVTEAREARHRLRDLAGRDPLTDLLNRRELTQRLRSTIGIGGFSMLFVDLDGLKQVNDSHGHLVGDQVIRAQARRLQAVVGPGHLVARYGGDEFVVVLSGVSDETRAAELAQRIHDAARAAITVGELSIRMTCSIGIAMSPTGDLDAALAAADEAVYEAKRAGRDCTRVYEGDRG